MKWGYFFILLLINCTSGHSQSRSLHFHHLSTKEGLSQSNITSIVQDSRGFMWFGTRDGLNKYDGYKFTVYKRDAKDNNSLSHNFVTGIAEDIHGDLWVATWGGGLSKYDRRRDKFHHFQNIPQNSYSLSKNYVRCLATDKEGKVWVGLDEEGVDVYDPKTNRFSHYLNNNSAKGSIDNNSVNQILVDSDQNVWIATDKGGVNLFNRKENNFIQFIHNPKDSNSLSSDRVWSLFEDSKKQLWIGTLGGGLNLYDKRSNKFKHFLNKNNFTGKTPIGGIISIQEDHKGLLWIASEYQGITIFNYLLGSFENLSHVEGDNSSLKNNSINVIYKDMKGNMWIGLFYDGINLHSIDESAFVHYNKLPDAKGLNNNKVLSMYEDADTNLWIGTDGGGINFFDRKRKRFSYLTNNESKSNICGNNVLSILEDDDKNIWVGTWASGLTIINKERNTFRHFKHNPQDSGSLPGNNIYDLAKDSDNNIWIACFQGGLSMYDSKNKVFRNFKHDKTDPFSIASNSVYTLYIDRKDNLWIGTFEEGLDFLDKEKGRFIHYKQQETGNSLSNNLVHCIYEDKKGNFWIGTNAGLNLFQRDKGIFTTYTTSDGLPNDVILSIEEDSSGNLWISTNKGLSRFNPRNKTFRNYNTSDGLQAEEFKPHSSCTSRSGFMYFGGINGFNEFNPDSLRRKYYDPPIVFTDFLISNNPVKISEEEVKEFHLQKHIAETKEIRLPYGQDVLTFEFASLNYVADNRKEYSYMLEGFDKDWNFIDSKHSATYTNLDPGSYTLRVRGLDNNGDWSEKHLTLKLIITPPYWMTLWFRLLIALLLLGSFTTFYLLRMGDTKRQKKELENQVRKRTSELQLANRELQVQKAEIEEQREKLNELYTDIKDSIRSAEIIQQFILPSEKMIKKFLPETFILYRPKDVVSGDFYWFEVKEDCVYLAVADCTGHGISGAFMSINGHHLLNQGLLYNSSSKASEILDNLNYSLIKELSLKEELSNHSYGMDIALCIIDKDNKKLQYAGARNPLYIIRGEELIQIPGNKFSIGQKVKGEIKQFTNVGLEIHEGDMLYLFSDGFADQLGGPTGNEKFLYSCFRELLMKIKDKSPDEQRKLLEEALLNWMGKEDQLDDILVMGIRIG